MQYLLATRNPLCLHIILSLSLSLRLPLRHTSQTPSTIIVYITQMHESQGEGELRVSTKRASVNVRAIPPELYSMSSRGQERGMNSFFYTLTLY